MEPNERESGMRNLNAGRLPDFAPPHDGRQTEIPEAEKQAVARGFNSLFEDILLNYAENFDHAPWQKMTFLRLKLPADGKEFWAIRLMEMAEPPSQEMSLPHSEQVLREVAVQKITGQHDREYYELPTVRRWFRPSSRCGYEG